MLRSVNTQTTLPDGVTREAKPLPTDDAVSVALPVGFRATSHDAGFTLVVKSRPVWAWFVGLFALLWNGFLVVWFSIAIGTGAWGMAAAGSLHAAVGVVMGYLALRGLLNRIEVSVSRGVLTVRHRPLPWRRPPALARAEIEQLFVTPDRSLKSNGRVVERYALKVSTVRGKEHRLFIVDNPEQAQYFEREIERAFQIEDRALPDELARP